MTDHSVPPVSRGLHRSDLATALPDLTSPQRLRGLTAPVDIWRDPEGVPHARAGSLHDAFFAQGFVHAQDRLWHMEYDRRRACGRWAELLGAAAVPQDALGRRLGLDRSARADYEGAAAETRAMLDAYAAGVNAFLDATRVWPVEFQLLDTRPERWAPWDSLAVFKIRHVEMGPWQMKLWRARLVRQLGPRLAAYLSPGTPPVPMLILPPGTEYRGPAPGALEALSRSEPALASLPGWIGGSNSWVLAGARTASGRPLVAGDPHRALDTPNCYYQNHLACPDFDAIGLSFPGVPGLSHFGHNRHVAWCVTHAMADYQDVFVERYDPTDPWLFALGLALMRARFVWWPFHPMGFPLGIGGTMDRWWFALLIATALKGSILHYGGVRGFRQAAPFFMGLVLGQYVVACLWSILACLLNEPMYWPWQA